MPDTSRDPVDHVRTTRQHAGETVKNGQNGPGLIAVGIGVLALVISLAAFATAHPTAGLIAAVVAVIVAGAGLGWLAFTHRRVRQAEQQWHTEHPGRPAEPPTS
mgnify:FL=1